MWAEGFLILCIICFIIACSVSGTHQDDWVQWMMWILTVVFGVCSFFAYGEEYPSKDR
jgi:hypothetical protein